MVKKYDFIQDTVLYLYKRCPVKWKRKEALHEKFHLLYHKHNSDKKYEEFIIQKWSVIFKIVLIGSILSLVLWVQEVTKTSLLEGNSIERNQVGGGSNEVTLLANVHGVEKEIDLNIEAQSYNTDELDYLFMEMLPTLDQMILGKNISADYILSDLNLISAIEGYPFQIEWNTENTSAISQTGKIDNTMLKEEEAVQLTAKVYYQDYQQDYLFSVVLYPEVLGAEDLFFKELKETLMNGEKSTRESRQFSLPTEIEQTKVSWREKKKNSSIVLFLGCLLGGLLVGIAKEKEVIKQIEERERQLLLYYPDIVSKLTLFLGAGITLQGAIGKLVADYDKRRTENSLQEYVYEEFWMLNNEIKMGMSEANAYMELGKRCKLHNYKKLSTLLMQSLKKGTGNLLMQLENETKSALEDRKSNARKRGEEASTKMLGPMMLMLFIVMLIIIVPAFGSFST